jgi:four helix bundle protein
MSTTSIKTFKDLVVWQKALDLSVDIYRLSGGFPRHELFGLSAELRKTVRSVACNIAEGHKRGNTLEYIHFLKIAAGSAAELETQVLLACRLGYFGENEKLIPGKLAEVGRLLDALIRSMRKRHRANTQAL